MIQFVKVGRLTNFRMRSEQLTYLIFWGFFIDSIVFPEIILILEYTCKLK